MFLLVEEPAAIARAQATLERSIKREFSRRLRRTIGYPSAKDFNRTLWTDGVWWYAPGWHDGTGAKPSPRYLNWFGRMVDGDVQITLECNPSAVGSAMAAGFFARDADTGALYLLHSGRVGGGAKGVGKDHFLAWRGDRPIEVHLADGGIRYGVIVMPVEGRAATRPLIAYAQQVASFKDAVRAGDLDKPAFRLRDQHLKDFYREAGGRRTGRRSARFDYVSRHADVVTALDAWRRGRPLPRGGRIVKSILIDLGVAVGSSIREVFEVKTGVGRDDLYGAIGQLLVHGPDQACSRWLVIPEGEPLPGDVAGALARLNITVLRFRLDSDSAAIL